MTTITSKDMRRLDMNAEFFGVPVERLMESAGRAVAENANPKAVIADTANPKAVIANTANPKAVIANTANPKAVVIAGTGNNAGDGYVAARLLNAPVFYVDKPKSKQALKNFERVKDKTEIEDPTDLVQHIKSADVVIDALLGTGIKGKLREPVRTLIELINKHAKSIVSVDIPSGLDPDTGKIHDVAIKPKMTVTFHARKAGMDEKNSGEIVVTNIGIPPKAEKYIGKGDFYINFPRRERKAHKGEAGRVLIVGGSRTFIGAPYFAAKAALYAGCDLVTVASPKYPSGKIAVMAPDTIGLPLNDENHLIPRDVKTVLSSRYDVMCIGNGISDNPETLAAAFDIITGTNKPVVVDGDALKALKGKIEKLGSNVLLTPHAAEFMAITGEKPPDELEGREKLVSRISKQTKATIVLKGPVDIIAKDSNIKLNETGNPYMSKGGTGDVLAGLCAGLLAQGIDTFDAAGMACLVSGLAGELSYAEKHVSMTAGDVLHNVPEVIYSLLE